MLKGLKVCCIRENYITSLEFAKIPYKILEEPCSQILVTFASDVLGMYTEYES